VLISYDAVTNQVVAAGQNQNGKCFVGKGFFDSSNQCFIEQSNFKGEPILIATFNFINATELILTSEVHNSTNTCEIKYIKANPKDKNLGIQLFSVKDAMENNAVETIRQLGRIGFSYVETFVYNEGKFYGMTPLEFKKIINNNGLEFTGSMVFMDLPEDNNWQEIKQWWGKCISDHKAAGVRYITTSNNEIEKIKSIDDLKKYTEYYNEVGKMCDDNDIIFGFHNHQNEFLEVDGEVILDYWLQNTNPKYVHFQADLYWMKVGGVNPIDYFTKYPGRFFSWHVKDEAELGKSGMIDYEAIFEFAYQSGLEYTLVEIEKFNYDPLVSVEMGYHYLYDSQFEWRINNEKTIINH
jgi:sugar phosphate isomerase/epimerase